MKRYLTEFIGTFFLVLAIGLAVSKAGPFAPVAIGVCLACMVYMGGHVSGAHYNPAVTLGVWLRGKLTSAEVVPYMIAQLLGAVVAAAVVNSSLSMGVSEAVGAAVQAKFAVSPAKGADLLHTLELEAIFTFALVLVVLQTATNPKVEKNSFYGFAIGGVVLVGAYAAGPISGGAFNPAVGVGPALLAGGDALSHCWVYVVGPFIGAILAATVYKVQSGMDG
ncbi:MAG: aquaporin [Phycisphaerales bacterium]